MPPRRSARGFRSGHSSETALGGLWLLLVHQSGAADLVHPDVDVDLDVVGDLHERDAAVHAIVLAVEGHGSFDCAVAGSLARNGQLEGFGLGDSAYGKGSGDIKGVRAGLNNLRRVEGDQRVLFHVEEVFAFEFFVLHAASGVDRGRLDVDVQDARGDIGGFELQGGAPLVEVAGESDGGLYEELDGAVGRGGFEDGNLRVTRGRQQDEREKAEEGESHGD